MSFVSIYERVRRPINQPDHASAGDYTLPKGRRAVRLLSKCLMRGTSDSARDPRLKLPAHWLILWLVIERASHAYEIGARYERRFGSFAPTPHNSVYKTLDRLYDLGFVYASPATASPLRGPRSLRTIYTATPEGVEAHSQWRLSKIRPRHWRVELLARLATAAGLKRTELLTLIGLYEQMAIDHGEQIEPARASAPRAPAPSSGALSQVIGQLVYSEQRAITNAQLAWVRAAREQLQRAAP